MDMNKKRVGKDLEIEKLIIDERSFDKDATANVLFSKGGRFQIGWGTTVILRRWKKQWFLKSLLCPDTFNYPGNLKYIEIKADFEKIEFKSKKYLFWNNIQKIKVEELWTLGVSTCAVIVMHDEDVTEIVMKHIDNDHEPPFECLKLKTKMTKGWISRIDTQEEKLKWEKLLGGHKELKLRECLRNYSDFIPPIEFSKTSRVSTVHFFNTGHAHERITLSLKDVPTIRGFKGMLRDTLKFILALRDECFKYIKDTTSYFSFGAAPTPYKVLLNTWPEKHEGFKLMSKRVFDICVAVSKIYTSVYYGKEKYKDSRDNQMERAFNSMKVIFRELNHGKSDSQIEELRKTLFEEIHIQLK